MHVKDFIPYMALCVCLLSVSGAVWEIASDFSLTSKDNSLFFFLVFCVCVSFFFPFPQESEGFFLHALRINPNAASCHGNLGKASAVLIADTYFTVRDSRKQRGKKGENSSMLPGEISRGIPVLNG